MKHVLKRVNGTIIAESDAGTFAELVVKNKRNLAYADLSGADLAGSNLAGADLSFANLADANLDGANLFGANLGGVTIDLGGRIVTIK